jgi:hypothetical protein
MALGRLLAPHRPAARVARAHRTPTDQRTSARLGHARDLEVASSSANGAATEESLTLHCPGFASLKTSGAVRLEDAATLARSLPRLRSLVSPTCSSSSPPSGTCRSSSVQRARSCVGFNDNWCDLTEPFLGDSVKSVSNPGFRLWIGLVWI